MAHELKPTPRITEAHAEAVTVPFDAAGADSLHPATRRSRDFDTITKVFDQRGDLTEDLAASRCHPLLRLRQVATSGDCAEFRYQVSLVDALEPYETALHVDTQSHPAFRLGDYRLRHHTATIGCRVPTVA